MKINRKDRIKKILCAGMAGIMALSLTACGGKSGGGNAGKTDNGDVNPAADSKNYVYKSEEISLGDKVDLRNIRQMKKVGDRIWASGTEYAAEETNLLLMNFNPDGSDLKEIRIKLKPNMDVSWTAEQADGSFYAIRTQYSESAEQDEIIPYENGKEAVVRAEAENASDAAMEETKTEESDAENDAIIEEDQYFIEKYAADGTLLFSTEMKNDEADRNGEPSYFYISAFLDAEDVLLVGAGNQAFLYSKEDGSLIKAVELPDGVELNNFYKSASGKLYADGYKTANNHFERLELCEIDTKTGKLIESAENGETADTFYNFYQGGEHDFVMKNEDGIYAMNAGDKKPVKLMDFIASDMETTDFTALVSITDKDMLVQTIGDNSDDTHLYRLTKINPEDVKEKKTLTLGCNHMDSRIRKQIVTFNKTSEEYRIDVVDYSKYATNEDYMAGLTRFNTDLASGNVPDIIMVSSDMPVESYVSKGLFEDMNPYMEKDEELSKNQYLTNIFEAYSGPGKLYQIIPSFNIQTMIAKSSLVGTEPGISVEQMQQIAQQKGVDYKFLMGLSEREMMSYIMMIFGGHQFIDMQNKTCNFKSKEFFDYLNFIKLFPEKLNDEDYQNDTSTFYRSDKSLFQISYMGNFTDYNQAKKGVFGEDITLIGFPNGGVKDYSGTLIEGGNRFAMSTASQNKEAVWAFLRTLLLPEFQDNVYKEGFSWPVLVSSIDKLGELAQQKPFYTGADGEKIEYTDTYWMGDKEVEITPMTQEEVQFIKDVLAQLHSTNMYNMDIITIISEETAPFFSGQKTAEEVAEIIQSRVQIYINENS